MMTTPPLTDLDPAETARMAPIFDESRYKTRIEMRDQYERRIGLLKRKLAILELDNQNLREENERLINGK